MVLRRIKWLIRGLIRIDRVVGNDTTLNEGAEETNSDEEDLLEGWKPEFNLFEEVIDSTAVWMRVPNLPIELLLVQGGIGLQDGITRFPMFSGVWFELLRPKLNSSQATDSLNPHKCPCVAFRLKSKEKCRNLQNWREKTILSLNVLHIFSGSPSSLLYTLPSLTTFSSRDVLAETLSLPASVDHVAPASSR
ncbi:uncharacterized protein G2W53_040711 [Senna tora]|uniref:Uncharacterized protein n=1 Tax=Senna tora TaxID=362788 RepID=A0A834SFP4_9FABA|nr:uncharacterized protein G2W53_040711 [Senna tora]